MAHFETVEEEDIIKLIMDKDSKSTTTRTIKSSVKLFRDFLTGSGIDPNFETLSNEDLNKHQGNFMHQ